MRELKECHVAGLGNWYKLGNKWIEITSIKDHFNDKDGKINKCSMCNKCEIYSLMHCADKMNIKEWGLMFTQSIKVTHYTAETHLYDAEVQIAAHLMGLLYIYEKENRYFNKKT